MLAPGLAHWSPAPKHPPGGQKTAKEDPGGYCENRMRGREGRLGWPALAGSRSRRRAEGDCLKQRDLGLRLVLGCTRVVSGNARVRASQ